MFETTNHIYIYNLCKGVVRGYATKIWLYIIKDLQFRNCHRPSASKYYQVMKKGT